MTHLNALYRIGLGLLTDLYQLTMAQGYLKAGPPDREAVFHLFFRENPFGGGLTVACGLATAIEYLEGLRFDPPDIDYLATLRGNDDRALFDREFLDFLGSLAFECDVDAVPEGTVVFPHEPLLRVRGPLVQAQIIETALLNAINFQTLVATKAARVVQATRGEPVLEFGLRRAQGIDGGMTASRAAYIGGCSATSNVLAGRLFDIPVKGTHAHSWVMCFDDETEAFEAYAQAMPNNCVFLVDTYDTLAGVRRAIEAGRRLRRRGHEMVGIRLDSGDLASLSIEARRLLDAAGFPRAAIIASNDLDEHLIEDLKQRGATIGVWGVGTKLVTAYDQPALGGVYKLSATRIGDRPWQDTLKLSEQAAKISTPGLLQVRRYVKDGQAVGDAICDLRQPPRNDCTIVDLQEPMRRKTIAASTASEGLLVPVFRKGKSVYDVPSIEDIRHRTSEQLGMFHSDVKRFAGPCKYPVGLEQSLHERKLEMILETRGEKR